MKQIIFVMLVIPALFVLSLTGCSSESFTYELRQDKSAIEKVEISTYDHDSKEMVSLVSLSKDDIDILINDIQSLECYEFFPLDPILSYGDVVVCIAYYDGEVEILGITNIGFISPDGEWTTTRKYFNIKDICNVITKFVDPDVLSENSDYF